MIGRDATVVLEGHHSVGLSVGAAVGGCCGHQGALVVGTLLSTIKICLKQPLKILHSHYLHHNQPC